MTWRAFHEPAHALSYGDSREHALKELSAHSRFQKWVAKNKPEQRDLDQFLDEEMVEGRLQLHVLEEVSSQYESNPQEGDQVPTG